MRGSLVVIPGMASIEMNQWYDRYVPSCLMIVKQTTTPQPAVKINPIAVPKQAQPKVVAPEPEPVIIEEVIETIDVEPEVISEETTEPVAKKVKTPKKRKTTKK